MFAENLKKVMDQKGITSAALARKSGFSKGAVSQWRNGIYTPSHEKNRDPGYLCELCHAYEI